MRSNVRFLGTRGRAAWQEAWQRESVGGLAAFAASFACGILIGVLLVVAWPKVDSLPARRGGERAKVFLGGRALAEHVDVPSLARQYADEIIRIHVPGQASPIVRTRRALGARLDAEVLSQRIADRAERRPVRTKQVRAGGRLDVPLPHQVDQARLVAAFVDIKDATDRDPRDARFDVPNRALVPEESGRRLDVYPTLTRLDAVLSTWKTDVEAAVVSVPAARPAGLVGQVRLDEILGYFETKYARDAKHEARTFNLRLAASKLDGTFLMPGETFDLNAVVGPRTEANGYKVAPVIAEGELVDGIGGGTCQIAGTLHGAALFAGLDIVERRPHTRPSFYIKMGMDAAVAYPSTTLKIRNPFAFPVVLHETVEGGVVRAEVLGAPRSRDVTFVRKINDVVPFQEKEVVDPDIPDGDRVLAQRGIPGFKITRYRIVRDGPFAVRERTQDTYPPTAQIWKIGIPGKTDPKFKAEHDEHPEYVADEYLSISQGPHVINPKTGAPTSTGGGATVESRVAGRYGTHGWTEAWQSGQGEKVRAPSKRAHPRKSAKP